MICSGRSLTRRLCRAVSRAKHALFSVNAPMRRRLDKQGKRHFIRHAYEQMDVRVPSTPLLSTMTDVLADPQGEHGDAGRYVLRLLGEAGWLASDQRRHGLVIGIDLGGTKLLAAMSSADGKVLAEIERPTLPADPLGQITLVIAALLAQAQVTVSQVAQVVVGVPGAVASDGRVMQSPHVQFPVDRSFADALSSAVGIPVAADNDVNIAAFGEYASRPERAGGHLAFVALGTGIGTGLIMDGVLLRGAHGAAGEIAGMPYRGLPVAGQADNTYEAVMSSQGIRQRHGEAASVKAIFDDAQAGDKTAQRAVEDTLDDLAVGLATVVSLIDPGLIVLGGGIGARAGVAEAMTKRLAGMLVTPCMVETSRLGARAGLIGALAYARHRARITLLARVDAQQGAAA